MNIKINGIFIAGIDDSQDSINYLREQGFKLADIDAAFNVEKWTSIRKKRDKLMFEADWTQVSDCPLSTEKKAEFMAYRQILREIPQTYSDPDNVVWPEKPTI